MTALPVTEGTKYDSDGIYYRIPPIEQFYGWITWGINFFKSYILQLN